MHTVGFSEPKHIYRWRQVPIQISIEGVIYNICSVLSPLSFKLLNIKMFYLIYPMHISINTHMTPVDQ